MRNQPDNFIPMNISPILKKHFDFLIDLGFKGPFEYCYVREIHTNYVKGNVGVKIIFEGSFWVCVIKTKKYIWIIRMVILLILVNSKLLKILFSISK